MDELGDMDVINSSSQVNFIKKKYLLIYLGNLGDSLLWVQLNTRAYMTRGFSWFLISVSVLASILASFCCSVERFSPRGFGRWLVISLKFKISHNCDSKGEEEIHLIWNGTAVTWRTDQNRVLDLFLNESWLLEVLRPRLAWHGPLLTLWQSPVMVVVGRYFSKKMGCACHKLSLIFHMVRKKRGGRSALVLVASLTW